MIDIEWVCYVCAEDLGDHSTTASGDCVVCGRIVCETHFAVYDERTGFVVCPQCKSDQDQEGV